MTKDKIYRRKYIDSQLQRKEETNDPSGEPITKKTRSSATSAVEELILIKAAEKVKGWVDQTDYL